jgi:type IV pilus assembly protein PilW
MKQRKRECGFSLIELMVGLVIGLVSILIIGQVMAVFEAQKRTSTGGADAQTNGASALAVLEQEIRMAGFGLVGLSADSSNGTQLCPNGVYISYNGTTISNPVTDSDHGIPAPVRIVDDGTGTGSQAIITIRSDAEFSVLTNAVRTDVNGASPLVTIDSNLGYVNLGQLFLIAPATPTAAPCTLLQLSAAPAANGTNWNLPFSAGASYPYNPANWATFWTAFTSNGYSYPAGSKVINLGYSPAPPATNLTAARSFMYRSYQVQLCDHEPKLTVVDWSRTAHAFPVPACNATTDTTAPLADQIIYLRAQYGVATAAAVGSQTVDQWFEPTGSWANNALNNTPGVVNGNISRIKVVRIGVVARSSEYEKDYLSPATVNVLPLLANGPAVDYTVPDQHYRYKVFYTVVPMKNVIWGNLQ